jgi:hypothetical protein
VNPRQRGTFAANLGSERTQTRGGETDTRTGGINTRARWAPRTGGISQERHAAKSDNYVADTCGRSTPLVSERARMLHLSRRPRPAAPIANGGSLPNLQWMVAEGDPKSMTFWTGSGGCGRGRKPGEIGSVAAASEMSTAQTSPVTGSHLRRDAAVRGRHTHTPTRAHHNQSVT